MVYILMFLSKYYQYLSSKLYIMYTHETQSNKLSLLEQYFKLRITLILQQNCYISSFLNIYFVDYQQMTIFLSAIMTRHFTDR